MCAEQFNMAAKLDSLYEMVDINAVVGSHEAIGAAISESNALIEGHFALHQARHAVRALRFRGTLRFRVLIFA